MTTEAATTASDPEEPSAGCPFAEEDLRQRGMGDLLGVRQAGDNSEGFGGADDLDLVVRARELMSRPGPLRDHYLERARRRPRD